jgi:hypothetical protein
MAASSLYRLLRSAIAGIERDVDTIQTVFDIGEEHNRKVRLLAYAGYRNATVCA